VFCDDGRVVDEKEREGDKVENDMENPSGYEKSRVRLALLDWKDIVSV
jgi:hypothetical protein